MNRMMMAAALIAAGPAWGQSTVPFSPHEVTEMTRIYAVEACLSRDDRAEILFISERLGRLKEAFVARGGDGSHFDRVADASEVANRAITDALPMRGCFRAGRDYQRMRGE